MYIQHGAEDHGTSDAGTPSRDSIDLRPGVEEYDDGSREAVVDEIYL